METYNNDYTATEDRLLWELHEIRHALHQDMKGKTLEEINAEGLKTYQEWKQQKHNRSSASDNSQSQSSTSPLKRLSST